MLKIRISDIEPTETTDKKGKTGATIRHLHSFGIKSYAYQWNLEKVEHK